MSGVPFGVGGASPLTRGKLYGIITAAVPLRRIPAHAGKTALCMEFSFSRGAHPRSRGENCEWFGQFSSYGGASPLTRGKPAAKDSTVFECGRIPAHAGKTPRWRSR